ncbi:MAG: lactonase family protein [Acidobacteriaceae bacterium]
MMNLTRRSFLSGLATLPFAERVLWSLDTPRRHILVGTYTEKGSKGIYSYRWNSASGELAEMGLAAATPEPSFLALSPGRKGVYAVNEIQGGRSGTVSAFSIGASAKLSALNVVPSGGAGPCNVTTDHTGQALFVANYDSGSLASFQILPDRSLSGPVANIFYKGHSVDPARQREAHTHCTTVSPDNRYLLVNDLGMDRIMVYKFDPKTAKPIANGPPFYSAIPGSGPRNLTFHPNGRWAYSVQEMGSTVDGLNWDAAGGILTRFQDISTLAKGDPTPSKAATVAVHPNGHTLYASNRGQDSIAVFTIDRKNGTLTPVQHISCGGKTPRHFAVDPTGKWMVIANQDSANLVVLQCNVHTGRLTATGRQYPLDSPVCVVFE